MRFIFFLLVTFVFTACGHHKIRFSKVEKKQKVVEISEIPSLKNKSETAFQPQIETEETLVENTSVSSEEVDSEEIIEENVLPSLGQEQIDFPKTVEDSTQLTVEELDEISQEALRAQKLGTWSLISSIATPVLFLIAVIVFAFAVFGGGGPLGAIFSIILAVSMLVFLVLSYVFGISSLRAQYNTPRGRKFAIAGLVIISSFLGLFLLNILFGLF